MKVYLGVNVRDEKHFREWVIHHLNIGFDKIFITDHKSTKSVANDLEPLKEYLYLLHEDKEMKNLKQKCMTKFLKFCKSQKVDWMIYLDADEFIVLNDDYMDIKEYIESIPNDIPSIGIPWLCFGSNYLVKDPDDLIISSYTKCNSTFDNHTKSLSKVKEIIKENGPHLYENKSNKYSNIFFDLLSKNLFHDEALKIKSEKVNEMPIFIAHYTVQSRETMIKRKLLLPRDDNGLFRDSPFEKKIVEKDLDDMINSKEHIDYFNVYNDIECLYIKDKYSNDIKSILNAIDSSD